MPFGIIYKITNKINGKSYIGQTTQLLNKRWMAHISKAKNGSNTHLQVAIRKYGIENFTLELLYECNTKTDLFKMEQHFISLFNTKENGYNKTIGGSGTGGWKHSEDAKKKISKSHKGKIRTEEHQRKLNISQKGKKISNETKKKMSNARKGITFTEEHKRKISNSLKGKERPDEVKRKIGESRKGKKHTNESKKKISESTKGENNPMYGKHHSEETKRKISESKKKNK